VVAAAMFLGYGPTLTLGAAYVQAGYFSATAAIASVVPPSIVIILYGASSEQSIAALFVAGIVPGLILGVLTAAYVVSYALRRGIRSDERTSWAKFLRASGDAMWALGTPLIILGGIYLGVFSPTEAAGIAGIYGILVTRFIYREISWRGIWNVTTNAVFLTSQIMIIVAASGVFAWILTVSGIPQGLTLLIERILAEPWAILLVINIFLLIVGCLVDPTSAIIVLTPLLVPIVKHAGIDLIHFGMVLTVNLSIGMFTPPFGLNIFTTQALFRVPVVNIYKGVIPFIFVQLIGLMIITYFPELSLFLTRFIVR